MPRPRNHEAYWSMLAAIRRNPRVSFRDLLTECKLGSLSTVYYYLNLLERDGLIHRETRLARSIQVGKGPLITRTNQRRNNSPETRAKKSTAGRKGRRVIDSVGKVKRDPELQNRIDRVVEKALAKDRDHSTDVINEYRHLKFRSSGLRCSKLG